MCNQLGSLLYLSTKTFPDIVYAVSSVARHCAKPTNDHCTAVKRILNGTRNFGLLCKANDVSKIKCYSDAD